jgi:hypothetical protein
VGVVATSFGLACVAVLTLTLCVEHRARASSDATMAATLLIAMWSVSNALVTRLGTEAALVWFPILDASGAVIGAWLSRRKPEAWRIVLTLAYVSMCALDVFHAYGGISTPGELYGVVVALNLGTVITLLAVAFPGGRYVAQAARRFLSRRRSGGGVVRAADRYRGRS